MAEHLSLQRQMAFVSGPRQVGKTTTCRNLADEYLNWDNTDDRALIASEIQVSVDTVRRWVVTLCNLHLGFLIRPWFKNVSRSLRKEPKWFLRDWSSIEEAGERAETFIACHLLKAVEGWNDLANIA